MHRPSSWLLLFCYSATLLPASKVHDPRCSTAVIAGRSSRYSQSAASDTPSQRLFETLHTSSTPPDHQHTPKSKSGAQHSPYCRFTRLSYRPSIVRVPVFWHHRSSVSGISYTEIVRSPISTYPSWYHLHRNTECKRVINFCRRLSVHLFRYGEPRQGGSKGIWGVMGISSAHPSET